MAVKTKEEILKKVSELIKDANTPDVIEAYEDISDTLDDLTTRVNDSTDWKTKYEENDKMWSEKYRDRFLHGDPEEIKKSTPDKKPGEDDTPDETPGEKTTFEELFTVEKGGK